MNRHIIGRAILLKYDKEKSIGNKDRNTLCDIIICNFLNEGKRLNNASISILADKIIEIFESEKKSTYLALLEKVNRDIINLKQPEEN